MARKIAVAVAALLGAMLSACAVPGDYRPELLYPEKVYEAYALGPGDRLRVIVFGQDALSNTYTVDGVGRIAMPLIGAVKVQGLHAAAVERMIAARLRNGYIRDPHVAVEVEAFRPFFIMGEVVNGGQYPFVDSMTVRTAIAIAGGYSPRGFDGGADLTRIINGCPVTGRVPLDYPVRPGDTITVLERIF